MCYKEKGKIVLPDAAKGSDNFYCEHPEKKDFDSFSIV